MRLLYWLPLLVALGACHETVRNNPLDPELTPGVEIVTATVDANAGQVQLEWTPYNGQQPFAYYQILRRARDLTAIDTLSRIDDRNTLAFADTTIAPQVDYVYQVAVFNQQGFSQLSPAHAVSAFDITAPVLRTPQNDNALGTIDLRWNAYAGPDFARYEIWRRSFGQEQLLSTQTATGDTNWTDATVAPRTEYFYWVRTFAAGLALDSPIREASFDLPEIELTEAALSHESATAALAWTRYTGPGFTGYEVLRRSGPLAEAPVQLIEDIDQTSHIDSLLDGNTLYEYRIVVRTHWDDVEVESNTLSDAFYQFVEQRVLSSRANTAAHALALALDENDGLYIGSTLILTTTAGTIERGLWIEYPDGAARRYFQSHTPDRLSAIHLTVHEGTAYATVRTEDEQLLLGAIGADRNELWLHVADLGDIFPVGLFVDADGNATVIDEQGLLHRFDAEGLVETDDRLNSSLGTDQALPLKYLFWDRRPIDNGDRQLFIVAPDRPVNHVVGRIWTGTFFGGRSIVYDDGVGPQNGQTLNPLVAAYDRLHDRVAVLEENGRLQIVRADQQAGTQYLTKWGTFGEGEGEFALSPPTTGAMAIDSAGRIYVADGAGDEGRVQIFAP